MNRSSLDVTLDAITCLFNILKGNQGNIPIAFVLPVYGSTC